MPPVFLAPVLSAPLFPQPFFPPKPLGASPRTPLAPFATLLPAWVDIYFLIVRIVLVRNEITWLNFHNWNRGVPAWLFYHARASTKAKKPSSSETAARFFGDDFQVSIKTCDSSSRPGCDRDQHRYCQGQSPQPLANSSRCIACRAGSQCSRQICHGAYHRSRPRRAGCSP